MLVGCCSLALMSSSIWISLSSLAERASSTSTSSSLLRRTVVVEKAAARVGSSLMAGVLAKLGRAMADERREAPAARLMVRGADRAIVLRESILKYCWLGKKRRRNGYSCIDGW